MTSYRVLVSNDSHAWTAVRNESGDVVSIAKQMFYEEEQRWESGGCSHGVFISQISQRKTTRQRLSMVPLILRANHIT